MQMPPISPNQQNKVISISIICLAIIASAFIYSHRATLFEPKSLSAQNSASLTSAGTGNTSGSTNATADWKQAVSNITVITPPSSQSLAAADAQSGNSTTDSNNLTAQVSKNFFSLYLNDQKNGVAIDNTEATNIADQSLLNVPASSLQAKQYTATDLHIISDASRASLLAYGKSASSLVPKDIPQGSKDPLTIMSNATQGTGTLTSINPLIVGYQKLISDTLKIPVPFAVVGDVLVYLDTLSAIENDMTNMSKMFTDPMAGYGGFNNYAKGSIALMAIVQQMGVDINK